MKCESGQKRIIRKAISLYKTPKNSAKAAKVKLAQKSAGKAKAIEHYEKFLDLWKDADPGIPEVDDAKKRVAELQIQ